MERKRMPKWQQKLTGPERKHLKVSGSTTITALKRNLVANIDAVNESKEGKPLCWECWFIGKKLGFITTETDNTKPHNFMLCK